MSAETKEVAAIEKESVLNGLSVNKDGTTQPNINNVSPRGATSVLKEEGNRPEVNVEENESGPLSLPRVGIRVKRELLAFDSNVGERVDTSEPEPERQERDSDMIDLPTAWPCPTCGFVYMSIQELQRHQPSCRHTLTRPHLCHICNESFERKQALNNHLVCHQTNRPHACRVCGNLHRTKGELLAHMSTHQSDKPHKCPTCGQEFLRHSSLTNHMKIHSYAAGRALVPPMFSPGKSTPLSSMTSPAKRNQSTLQQERSTEPIPSFETLPVPGYSYYNSLISSSNYASFLANKLMNNGGPSSKLGDQIMNSLIPPQLDQANSFASSSVSATQITCLPDIGQPSDSDPPEDISTDFQLPQQAFTVEDQTPFENPQDAETSEADQALNNYLSVKNAGLMFGIKMEEPFNPEQSTPQTSVGSPDDEAALVESQTEDLLREIQDSSDERSIPDPKCMKDIPIDASTSKPHMCQFCGIHFARLKAYQSHMKLHNDNWETGYQCQVCGQKFADYVALSVHAVKCMRGSRRDDDYSLSMREIPVLQQGDSISAKTAAANKQMFKHVCTSCDKRFATKQKLFRHMWIHRKKVFPCEACSEIFEERELLDRHRLEVHPPNESSPYACTVCGKSFTSRQTLWEHGRVHGGTGSGATLLWCQECNKSFASRQGYQIHTRTHTGERPYGCRYCMKSFRDGGTLRKHERIHTGERPHACPLCMRAFNQKVVLREHVRWVHAATTTGEPPLPCMLCGTSLPDREALCAHIVKHSDDMASEVRAAAKISNAQAKQRRGPRRNSKVLLQATDGKFVSIEKEDLPVQPTRPTRQPRQRTAARATATTTSGDSMDESSHSTPGSPFNFPKVEPPPADQPPSRIDFPPRNDERTMKTMRSRDDSSEELESIDENIPIPSFSEIASASSAQSLRLEEPAPNVTVADIPDSEYHFMNQEISLPSTSLENDMVDPMAYMQVVTDTSPNSQDVLNRLSVEEQDKEVPTEN